jgi:hypothetical protein
MLVTMIRVAAAINFTSAAATSCSMDELYPIHNIHHLNPHTPYMLTVGGMMMLFYSALCVLYPVTFGDFRPWFVFSIVSLFLSAITQLAILEHRENHL